MPSFVSSPLNLWEHSCEQYALYEFLLKFFSFPHLHKGLVIRLLFGEYIFSLILVVKQGIFKNSG